jgi:Na+/H+-dicarboxylate symporter
VPQGSLLLLAGVMTGVGVPAEGIALLMAADTIPDLVGTMANVSADLVATTLVCRLAGGRHDYDSPTGDPVVAGEFQLSNSPTGAEPPSGIPV